MSWYLFKDSPERQLRGKKVDNFQNVNRTKLNLDWGLGQLSSQKQLYKQQQLVGNNKSLQKKEQQKQKMYRISAIQQTIKILTQSSDEQLDKQQLLLQVKNHNKKHDNSKNPTKSIQKPQSNKINNNSLNVLNQFVFGLKNTSGDRSNLPKIDKQTAKRMRFLQNSLLPMSKQDNMSVVLDFQLNKQVSNSMGDSRVSRKSHLGNKKNDSAVELGDGSSPFKQIKQKVKDMNTKLKEMYQYDQWCKNKQRSQIRFG